jgi:hypothetical protein
MHDLAAAACSLASSSLLLCTFKVLSADDHSSFCIHTRKSLPSWDDEFCERKKLQRMAVAQLDAQSLQHQNTLLSIAFGNSAAEKC